MNVISLDARHTMQWVPGQRSVLLRDGTPLDVSGRLRDLTDRLTELAWSHNTSSHRFEELRARICREIERASVYAVRLHDGRHTFIDNAVHEKAPEWGRERLLDGRVYHLDLPLEDAQEAIQAPWEERLVNACKRLTPLHLLGVKPRDRGASGVFLPTPDFERGLRQAFGDSIAQAVLDSDRLDRLQLLTILAHREGKPARRPCRLRFPSDIDDDERYDGLVADLDHRTWKELVDAFQLPEATHWLQVTILDRDQGLATKGALRRCPTGRQPRTYSASWKIGLPSRPVDGAALLVHETDRTYRPRSSINLQMLAFNFAPEEQRRLIHDVFLDHVRGLLDYSWTAKLRGVDRLLAAGADMRLEPVCHRVNYMRRKLALESVHKAEVPGLRAKVTPDPDLAPYTVRVPRGSFEIGSFVDVTRDPSLPVGNSTQRCQVVDFTEGNVVELGPEPWMTVQGGDFDGDDACLQTTTVELFPDKQFDRTPVGNFRQAKKSHRLGVQDETCRLAQALRTLHRPIGPNDLLARRLLEEERLDRKTRLHLSECIQAAIDSAKHSVDVPDAGVRPEWKEHAIDAIRCGGLRAPVLAGTVYAPLAEEALRVAEADLEPVSFDPMPIRLAWAAMAGRFHPDDLAEPSRLAGIYNARFVQLLQQNAGELAIDKLVDEFLAEAEGVTRRLRAADVDLRGCKLPHAELALTCVEVAVLRFASIHFASRAVRMQTLKLVFDKDAAFVRQALQAVNTRWQTVRTPL